MPDTFKSALIACGALLLAGCVNLYTHVDEPPAGQPGFHGIRDFVSAPALHVVQMHGMGDHPSETFCADDDENYRLQRDITDRLGYAPIPGLATTHPIYVDEKHVGSYTTHQYTADPANPTANRIFFTCLTWGEASRAIKLEMLGLDKDFLEENQSERHRAPINRKAKQFVNQSFSDPVIYVGGFGPIIRQAVWKGLQEANATYAAQQPAAFAGGGTIPMVVLSDSLGSRVLFDVLCEREHSCTGEAAATSHLKAMDQVDAADAAQIALAAQTRRSIRAIFMLANQLPLLELASLKPVAGKPLDASFEGCAAPILQPGEGGDGQDTTIVAFTDSNDALSYELSEKFKARCAAPGVTIYNVVVPNARLRWVGLYTNLLKAHASGFKTNKRAITYMVEGQRAD